MPLDELQPLPSALPEVCLIASDLDGTLTTAGRLSAGLLETLQALAAAGWPVLLVTGRSAGWVAGLRAYLPGLVGALAENGGVCFRPDADSAEELLTALPADHRLRLRAAFEALRADFPQLEEAADNRFRLTDWTFANRDLSLENLQQLRQRCEAAGFGFTYSNVQCHLYPPGQDKASGLVQVLRRWFPQLSPAQVLTVGDSPNDESLFDPALFPQSVGVAGLKTYAAAMAYRPRYLTQAAEGEGFRELAAVLLRRP